MHKKIYTTRYNNTEKFKKCFASGIKFEDYVAQLLSNYTDLVVRNFVMQTELTKIGVTEADIAFYYRGRIIILELKNVKGINGTPNDLKWDYFNKKEVLYQSLSAYLQNKMHVRSFKTIFYKLFGYFPNVESNIIVPDVANICDELKSYVSTISQFLNYIDSISNKVQNTWLKYHFISIVNMKEDNLRA